MRHVLGWIVAGAIVLGSANSAKAQFGLTVGTPLGGTQVTVGAPYGVYAPYTSVYGYTPYATSVYVGNPVATTTYTAPAAVTYSSGYRGYLPTTAVYTTPVYGYPVLAPGAVVVRPRGLLNRWRPLGVWGVW